MLGETIQALVPALLHVGKLWEDSRSRFHDNAMQRERCLAFVFDERDRVKHFELGVAFGILKGARGKDQPFRFNDFVKDALAWVYYAIGSAHVNAESAAEPYVQLAHRVRKVQSPQRCLYTFGFLH